MTIITLTEGNPFFVEEILTSLITTGGIFYTNGNWERKPLHELHIPRSIQDAVQQRTAQLSEQARHLLTLAAVAGRRFDFTLLQQIMQCDEQQLFLLIKELIAAQLVIEESDERFAFRHALTRQVISAELLARERKVLHRTIAETMEGLYARDVETRLADFAYHFYEAVSGRVPSSMHSVPGKKPWLLRAPRCSRPFARLARGIPALCHRTAPMFHARGQAYELLGEFELARADYEAALEVARSTGENPRNGGHCCASACYGLDAITNAAVNTTSTPLNWRAHRDRSTLAHSLNRLGNWHLNVERPLEALAHHQEALNIFQGLADQPGIAETLDLLGMTSYLSGDLLGGTAYYMQAVALFRELDDRQGLTSSLATLTMRASPTRRIR